MTISASHQPHEATGTAMLGDDAFTPRTDRRFPLDVLGISRPIYSRFCIYDRAHVAGWDPQHQHDLVGHVSWVGSVQCRSCTTSHNRRWVTRRYTSWSIWPVRRVAAFNSELERQGVVLHVCDTIIRPQFTLFLSPRTSIEYRYRVYRGPKRAATPSDFHPRFW